MRGYRAYAPETHIIVLSLEVPCALKTTRLVGIYERFFLAFFVPRVILQAAVKFLSRTRHAHFPDVTGCLSDDQGRPLNTQWLFRTRYFLCSFVYQQMKKVTQVTVEKVQ
jgi:hypothetical protein